MSFKTNAKLRTIFMKFLLILVCIISISRLVIAQDTSFITGPYIFDEDEIKGKKHRYGTELIRFSKNSASVEQCYYVNKGKATNRIIVYCTSYHTTDSLLSIYSEEATENWYYRKQSDSLFWVYNDCESGTASSLIPFVRHGTFDYFYNGRLIIKSQFENGNLINYITDTSEYISGTIYKFTEVDSPPVYGSGHTDLLSAIGQCIQFPNPKRESQIQSKVFLSIVVTEKGDIRQIKVLRSMGYEFDIAAIKAVACLGGFTPAIKDGKAVNAEMILPLEFHLD